jgi:cholesterol transport system auxiliary component
MIPRRCLLLLTLASALPASGCALTDKNTPIVTRYFSPERDPPHPVADKVAAPPSPSAAQPLELRIGRIGSASYLDERIAYRDTPYELGFYQERSWTEAPEGYLRRRLNRVLFEERGLRRVVGGAAPTLDVELTAFEEMRVPQRVARVQLVVALRDARAVHWEETLTVDEPVVPKPGEDPANAAVEALGTALRAMVDRVADRVARELQAADAAGAAGVPGATGAASTATAPGAPAPVSVTRSVRR